jgi:GTP-binding protein
MTTLPLVAVIGRPNVGKSTLFNRIVGRRVAIVEERPGVTRDRKELEVDWLGRSFRLVDTGGWLPGGDQLDEKVSRQSEQAMDEADVVLLVVDGTVGVADEDARVAELLRKADDRPTFVVVNKIDSAQREGMIWEFLSLGLGDPLPLSALHGHHTGDLLDTVIEALPSEDELAAREEETKAVESSFILDDDRPWSGPGGDVPAVAVIGRPNVGKSTLFNRLIGEDRAVVHDMPGTTRDTVDTIVETEEGPLRFVDTAGMRRRAKVDEGTEYYSVVRALQAVDDADVALLVIDGTVGVTHQDQRLAERVDAAGCPIVIVLNKWELLDSVDKSDVRTQVGDRLHFLGEAPVLSISALSGKGVGRLIPALGVAIDAYQRRVPTKKVNDVVQRAQQAHPAPGGARVLYATQGAAHPPTFTLFVNREVPRTWLRYLENQLRQDLGLGATPVKLRVRKRN